MITRERFFDKIGLSAGGISAYREAASQDAAYWSDLLKKDREAFFEEIRSSDGFRKKALRIYLDIAYNNGARFAERKIAEQIYFDTCGDIAIWCGNCHKSFREYGLDELEWVAKSIDFRLFRLGRLQFELTSVGEAFNTAKRDVYKDDILLNIHIPQGSPLGINVCLDSISEAKAFFKGTGGFVCDSWLLCPDLKQILPAQSNIVRFQNLFEVLRTDYTSGQAEERIFGGVLEDAHMYPGKTSLQIAARDYILSGRKLGTSYGYLKDG
jgi:hypothetical protein